MLLVCLARPNFLILVLYPENFYPILIVICCYYVIVPPKITPFSFGDEPMSFGEPVSIQCTISGGDLPVEVFWKLNGKSIPSNIEVSLSKIGKRINALTIETVTAHHAGNYTCLAQNLAGEAELTSSLFVIGLFRYLGFFYLFPKSSSYQ